MAGWNKWLWGGLGWAMFGPIGGIMAYALGSMAENTQGFSRSQESHSNQTQTRGGDFGAVILILFAAVMKADHELKKSELEFVKQFLIQQFGVAHAQKRLKLFQHILQQDVSIKEVCLQVKQFMDHASRLQLVHVLFGLSQADGHVHPEEVKVIYSISQYLGISRNDYEAILAMFYKDTTSAYKILKISPDVSDVEAKKAYRRMANKFHPDKVHHLGEDFQKMAEDKFKKVNEAYQQIKIERGI
ncbi:MAG: TerB family tellurite resistance protein [Myxococcota bacterium]|jgi:DnaJ like chaperone protein|nr:TerB family tellurite resistance protein [Myxococcota bacterium]